MEIEPISYNTFQSLTSCTHALGEPDNPGFQWFATTDRRVAGRIFLEAKSEAFRITVLHHVRAGWEVRESSQLYGAYDDAEAALLEAIGCESVGKAVTQRDVPMRLRFGRGRQPTRTEAKPKPD